MGYSRRSPPHLGKVLQTPPRSNNGEPDGAKNDDSEASEPAEEKDQQSVLVPRRGNYGAGVTRSVVGQKEVTGARSAEIRPLRDGTRHL